MAATGWKQNSEQSTVDLGSKPGLTKKMSLRLYNTLNRRTETFRPLIPGQVSIYCCGVTVYDLCHLGHARSYIAWDVLRRYLIWLGYQVTFVQNFTDIDDKILNRASKEGCTMNEVSERNILLFHKDMDELQIMRPDKMPRATSCLNQIRSLIEELEQKGAAYSIEGDVYFSVKAKKDYGKLSGRDLNDQIENADGRVREEEGLRKTNPFDFALWKSAKQGETSFPSQWGQGRPGWHIECSAMVRQELGETIDIHLGGADLVFPHHENEIAQSETVTGKPLANYWLHNGMVNVKGQKMSKSLGNFTTIRALLDSGITPMTLRFFILQAHYRKPLDFTEDALKSAANGWKGLNTALSIGITYSDHLKWPKEEITALNSHKNSEISEQKEISLLRDRFTNAMNDDLNSSLALAVLFDIARPLRSLANSLERDKNAIGGKNNLAYFHHWKLLVELANTLGLKSELETNNSFNKYDDETKEQITYAIETRREAKSRRDFATADKIRNELKEMGVELIDKPNGKTDWIKT